MHDQNSPHHIRLRMSLLTVNSVKGGHSSDAHSNGTQNHSTSNHRGKQVLQGWGHGSFSHQRIGHHSSHSDSHSSHQSLGLVVLLLSTADTNRAGECNQTRPRHRLFNNSSRQEYRAPYPTSFTNIDIIILFHYLLEMELINPHHFNAIIGPSLQYPISPSLSLPFSFTSCNIRIQCMDKFPQIRTCIPHGGLQGQPHGQTPSWTLHNAINNTRQRATSLLIFSRHRFPSQVHHYVVICINKHFSAQNASSSQSTHLLVRPLPCGPQRGETCTLHCKPLLLNVYRMRS